LAGRRFRPDPDADDLVDALVGTDIPVGWPARPFGPVRRRPLDEVVHRNHW
jgi:hypothetical protein